LENPLEGYDPAEKPARILEAVVDLSQTQGGLEDVVDLKPVWMVLYRRIEGGSLEGEEAAKNVSEPLRNDLKRKGFGDQWPESPEELVDLAEDVLSQR
jgi:hypothetical protein